VIIVGTFLSEKDLVSEGRVVEVDEDRSVAVFRTEDGRRMIYITHGDKQTRLAMTRESAVALLDCLGASLESGE
jgi:hypothetical protein